MVEIFPPYESETARPHRVVRRRDRVHLRGRSAARREAAKKLKYVAIFPGSHYVTRPSERARDGAIKVELRGRLEELADNMKLVEAQRLEQRTCSTSGDAGADGPLQRHRELLAPPPGGSAEASAAHAHRLLPEDFCCIVDESHQTVPQIGRCTAATARARRRWSTTASAAVGARQPAAQVRGVGARRCSSHLRVGRRPAITSWRRAGGVVVEQVIRPPACSIRRSRCGRWQGPRSTTCSPDPRASKRRRVLVTTLTKRMAEDLTEYYADLGVRVPTSHSDIDTLERIEIIRELRGASSTCSSASTSCARASTCRRCRSSPSRRRQGGLPARRALAHPDLRPRRPQRQRARHHVRSGGDSAGGGTQKQMRDAAADMDFERAAGLRDRIRDLEQPGWRCAEKPTGTFTRPRTASKGNAEEKRT